METTAYAREEAEKKGMDGSQVTGASSSYARKYALNGLLAIDDTQDSDTTNQGDGSSASNAKPAAKANKPAPAPAPAPAPKPAEKKPLPARGSEEWKTWVKAVADDWHQKGTGKSAVAVFAARFEADENTMQDVLQLLQEDALELKANTNK